MYAHKTLNDKLYMSHCLKTIFWETYNNHTQLDFMRPSFFYIQMSILNENQRAAWPLAISRMVPYRTYSPPPSGSYKMFDTATCLCFCTITSDTLATKSYLKNKCFFLYFHCGVKTLTKKLKICARST